MHKQKPKTKSHTKPKSFNPHQLLWIVPLGLVVVVGCVYLSWVLQAPQREQAAQIERLNANAAKLQEVKEKLEKELPNVKKASFEKSCGQASAKYSEGTITCGGYMLIVLDGLGSEAVRSTHVVTKKITEEITGKKYKQDYAMDVTLGGEQVVSGASKLYSTDVTECSVMDQYFPTNSSYDKEFYTKSELEDGIYVYRITCNEIVPDFINGYTLNN